MPPEVESFLQRVANTLQKLEIILFFARNPSTVDTIEGIASRIYRSHDQVFPAVRDLCEKQVLVEYQIGNGAYRLYSLTEDERYRHLSEQLNVLYHNDPAARVEIIKKIMTWQLKKTSSAPQPARC